MNVGHRDQSKEISHADVIWLFSLFWPTTYALLRAPHTQPILAILFHKWPLISRATSKT